MNFGEEEDDGEYAHTTNSLRTDHVTARIQDQLLKDAKFHGDEKLARTIAEYICVDRQCALGEDPILLIHCLPALHAQVHPANPFGLPGINEQLVVQALEAAAGGPQANIRGTNVAFHFQSHQALLEARRRLSDGTAVQNVVFAFSHTPQAAWSLANQWGLQLNPEALVPKVETSMITTLSPKDESIAHDEYDFFYF